MNRIEIVGLFTALKKLCEDKKSTTSRKSLTRF